LTAIEDFLTDCDLRMHKSIDATRTEFNSVRTGRASAGLLDRITIDYYGTPTPLNNMATISAPEARLLSIQPYDASQIKAIEKAIQESDLGAHPVQRRKLIRLPIPASPRSAARSSSRSCAGYARREGRDRNVRRDVMKHLEELVRTARSATTRSAGAEAQVQKLTDDNVKTLDEMLKHKEAEIMEV
jgi:ribosome recycling factor